MWQPWAMFTLPQPSGAPPLKGWETRHWSPLNKGGLQRLELPIPVVIHATKRLERKFLESINPLYAEAGYPRIVTGALIGVGIITEVQKTDDLLRHWKEMTWSRALAAEQELGDYSPGRFAWKLEEVRALLHPIPFTGRQEPLYKLDSSIEKMIDTQLGTERAPT